MFVDEEIAAGMLALQRHGVLIPRWRLLGVPPEHELVATRYDHTQTEQMERILRLIRKLLIWRGATGFVLTAEAALGVDGDQGDAIVSTYVTRDDQHGVYRMVHRVGTMIAFGGEVVRFGPESVDPTLLLVLPADGETVTDAEIDVLKQMSQWIEP